MSVDHNPIIRDRRRWPRSAPDGRNILGGRRAGQGLVVRGFTLAELVIVVTIMGIAAAMAAPRFASSMAHQRVDAAARRIVVDLLTARRQAIVTSASQSIQFDIIAKRYELPGRLDLEKRFASTYAVNLSDPPYEAEIVSADFGGDAEVMFDGFGRPDSGGAVVVAVGAYQKTVTLDAETGLASAP